MARKRLKRSASVSFGCVFLLVLVIAVKYYVAFVSLMLTLAAAFLEAKVGLAMDFMDRITPLVDDTIRALAAKRFIEDPIAGRIHSRTTSIVSSAYKRHGRILEVALRESLKDSNRHKVWQDEKFRVSREANS